MKLSLLEILGACISLPIKHEFPAESQVVEYDITEINGKGLH
jgi:hypothetical protein